MATPPPLPTQQNRQPNPALPDPAPLDWQTYFWLFFRFDGRVGREVYWLGIFFLSAIIGITGPFTIDPDTGALALSFGPMQSFIYTIATICSIAVSIKRLHDLNMVGYFAVGLLFFPIALIMSLWLGVRKGDEGPNRFAWQADVRPTQPPPQDKDRDKGGS